MKKCPYCDAVIEENARICLYCMKELEEKAVIANKSTVNYKWALPVSTLLVAVLILLAILLIKRPDNNDSLSNPTDSSSIETEHTNISGTEDSTASSTAETKGNDDSSNGTTDFTEGTTNTPPSGNITPTEGTTPTRPQTQPTTPDTTPTQPQTQPTTPDTTPTQPQTQPTTPETTPTQPQTQPTTPETTPTQPQTQPTTPETTPTQPQTPPTHTTVTYTYQTAPEFGGYAFNDPLKDIVITGVQTVADDGVYIIPDTIDGKNVVAIQMNAFSANNIKLTVKKVVIPNSVKCIHQGAFWGCYNLTDVYITRDRLEVQGGAFEPHGAGNYTVTFHSSAVCEERYGELLSAYVKRQFGAAWVLWDKEIDF